jgi:Holliday junction resolvase
MGGLKSQKVGKSWEQEIIDAYYKKGFQPFKIPTEIMGTCFDIIAIKSATVMCIEAKHITGDKLYFKSCGLQKKQDEINHFIKHCNTNIYIFVKSDKTGKWFTSWLNAYPIFKKKGYICKEDCMPFNFKEDD